MLIAVSAVLLALGALAYRRQLAPREHLALWALRVAVLALLALVLVGSVLTWRRVERPRHVIVLADGSQSIDALGLDSVVQRAAARFPLPDGVERRLWVMGDSAFEGSVSTDSASGRFVSRTRIGRSIELAAAARPAALVLVSDGQDNGELDCRTAAARSGIPVYTVGVGAGAARNVSVTGLVVPSSVRAGESIEVTVRLSAAGFGGERAIVRLSGQTREVALDAGPAETEARFRAAFARPGRVKLTATAESLPGESDYADNAWSEWILVGGGTRLVGYLSGRAGAQGRFVLAALAADSLLELRQVPAGRAVAGVPGWIDSLDVVILDNPVEDAANAGAYGAVLRRVRSGAGALVLAGFETRAGASLVELLGSAPQPGSGRPEPVELAPGGAALPWFADPVEGVRLESVPPFAGLRPLTEPVGGEQPWLQTASGRAAMLERRAGQGRVVYVAGYPLWRWGFTSTAAPGGGTALDRFLRGVVGYLADADTARLRLAPARPQFLSGEPARLILRAVAPGGGAWSGLDVVAGAVRDSAVDTVRLPMVEVGAGVYEADFAGLEPGEFAAFARARLADAAVGDAAARFTVAGQTLEMAKTGQDRQLLEDVARSGGGAYFDADSLPGSGFGIRRATFERRVSIDPRRSAWMFVAAALLAGLEWVLRRRKGLL